MIARGQARAEVLRRLRASAGRPLSGAALAGEIGVSRAAVVRQIAALRDLGYGIAAARRGGYVLADGAGGRGAGRALPAAAVPETTRRLRFVPHHRPLVGSTNAWARDLARAGAPEGTLAVADRQSAGRGRRGRAWLSPAGGIFCSVLLRPPLPPSAAPRLTLLAAVAVADGVAEASGLRAAIKWPNDVLIGGRKVCGILCEIEAAVGVEAEAAHEAPAAVIVGIGINVETDPAAGGRLEGVTSVSAAAGRRIGRATVLRAVLRQLDARYDELLGGGWPRILDAWRLRSATLGRRVRVRAPDGVLQGLAVDVDEEGALLVAERAGSPPRRLLAGEVTLAPGVDAGDALEARWSWERPASVPTARDGSRPRSAGIR